MNREYYDLTLFVAKDVDRFRFRLAFARPWTRPILKLLHRMGMM